MSERRRRIPDSLARQDRELVDFFQALLDATQFNIPVGGRIDWYGSTAPSGFIFLTGQTLALPAYQALADAGQSDITVGATSITLPTIANKIIRTY